MKEIKRIARLAVPAMVENTLQMLMGMVDSYLVSILGLVAISGVSVAGNILAIYQAMFIALGAATSSVVAKYRAQGDMKEVSQQASQALWLTVLMGGALGAGSLVGGQRLLLLLGTQTTVAEAGGLYLSLVGGGIVCLGVLTTLGGLLRASGKPNLPMLVSFLINLLNVIFSAFLVFICQMGILGVALGTVFARLLGVLLLWKQLPISLARPVWTKSQELLGLALPAAGERLMMRAGDVLIVALIVSFGTEVVGGNAIGETITQFNYMPGMGIATATVIVVAEAQARQDKKGVRRLSRLSFLLALGTMFAVAGFVWFAGRKLTGIYTQDEIALTTSLMVVVYSFLGTPATAGTLIYTATWQGLGNGKLPFYATTIGMWGIRIVLGYILAHILKMGVSGVWLATIVDNIFRWGFLYGRFQSKNRIDNMRSW